MVLLFHRDPVISFKLKNYFIVLLASAKYLLVGVLYTVHASVISETSLEGPTRRYAGPNDHAIKSDHIKLYHIKSSDSTSENYHSSIHPTIPYLILYALAASH